MSGFLKVAGIVRKFHMNGPFITNEGNTDFISPTVSITTAVNCGTAASTSSRGFFFLLEQHQFTDQRSVLMISNWLRYRAETMVIRLLRSTFNHIILSFAPSLNWLSCTNILSLRMIFMWHLLIAGRYQTWLPYMTPFAGLHQSLQNEILSKRSTKKLKIKKNTKLSISFEHIMGHDDALIGPAYLCLFPPKHTSLSKQGSTRHIKLIPGRVLTSSAPERSSTHSLRQDSLLIFTVIFPTYEGLGILDDVSYSFCGSWIILVHSSYQDPAMTWLKTWFRSTAHGHDSRSLNSSMPKPKPYLIFDSLPGISASYLCSSSCVAASGRSGKWPDFRAEMLY